MNYYENALDMREIPPAYRPRERLATEGPDRLSDTELVCVLLGSGTRGVGVVQLAMEVLDAVDRADGVPDIETLRGIRGLGPAKAAVFAAAFEFARRTIAPSRDRVGSATDVVSLVRHYAERHRETFLVVSLNGAHEVIAVHVASVGLVNRTMVHPREVYADALADRAAAIVAAHNHPSGNVDPSPEDREVTARLAAAGETLGVQLLDHVVFAADGSYYSFAESGTLPS
jgi:DNA repair protein RadC